MSTFRRQRQLNFSDAVMSVNICNFEVPNQGLAKTPSIKPNTHVIQEPWATHVSQAIVDTVQWCVDRNHGV